MMRPSGRPSKAAAAKARCCLRLLLKHDVFQKLVRLRPASLRSRFVAWRLRDGRQPLYKFDDGEPERRVLNRIECLGEAKRATIGDQRSARLAGEAVGIAGGPFQQGGDRNLENLGDARQPAGANSIGALLVLLHLLKGYAESLRQFRLRQPSGQTPESNVASYDNVIGIRSRRRPGATRGSLGTMRQRISSPSVNPSASRHVVSKRGVPEGRLTGRAPGKGSH